MDKLLDQRITKCLYHLSKRSGQTGYPFEQSLLPKQRAFIYDPAKRKTGLCDRRSGKTFASRSYLLKTSLDFKRQTPMQEKGICLYLARNRKRAKDLMWNQLKSINAAYNLGGEPNNTDLELSFMDTAIWLSGLDSEEDAEKWRGSPFLLVLLDESGLYSKWLEYVIKEIISPGLMDYNGTLAMVGTPTAACLGAFYDATMKADSGYSKHEWSLEDNIYIPDRMLWLKEEIKRNHPG